MKETVQQNLDNILDEIQTSGEAQEIINILNIKTQEKENLRLRAMVDSHEELVGKCFKVRVQHSKIFEPMWRYYKIISTRSSNEFLVSALRFDEYPVYWFNYRSMRPSRPGDYYFGYYDFEGIMIEDFPAESQYQNAVEISTEEYDNAMNLYIKRLQALEWPADHSRWGIKKPGDPDWKQNFSQD